MVYMLQRVITTVTRTTRTTRIQQQQNTTYQLLRFLRNNTTNTININNNNNTNNKIKMTTAETTETTTKTMNFSEQSIKEFCDALSSKQSIPGGGAAAAIGAAIGAASAKMAAAYSQRKQDEINGTAIHARTLQTKLSLSKLYQLANDDAIAYLQLQQTWSSTKSSSTKLSLEEIQKRKQNALLIPMNLLKLCNEYITLIYNNFILNDGYCNKNIISDAYVGIHLLCSSAKCAYQTALVNNPNMEEKKMMKDIIREIHSIEWKILQLDNDDEDEDKDNEDNKNKEKDDKKKKEDDNDEKDGNKEKK